MATGGASAKVTKFKVGSALVVGPVRPVLPARSEWTRVVSLRACGPVLFLTLLRHNQVMESAIWEPLVPVVDGRPARWVEAAVVGLWGPRGKALAWVAPAHILVV